MKRIYLQKCFSQQYEITTVDRYLTKCKIMGADMLERKRVCACSMVSIGPLVSICDVDWIMQLLTPVSN